jgi:hypothetical protein
MYSFSGNCAASVPISTIMSVSNLYTIPRIGPHISCSRIGRWEYINRSQTHEYGNWDCSRVIPFVVIFVSNFRYWFFAVCSVHYPVYTVHCTYNDALLLTGRPDAEALDRPVRRRRRRALHPLPDLRGPGLLGVRHEGLILTDRFNLGTTGDDDRIRTTDAVKLWMTAIVRIRTTTGMKKQTTALCGSE